MADETQNRTGGEAEPEAAEAVEADPAGEGRPPGGDGPLKGKDLSDASTIAEEPLEAEAIPEEPPALSPEDASALAFSLARIEEIARSGKRLPAESRERVFGALRTLEGLLREPAKKPSAAPGRPGRFSPGAARKPAAPGDPSAPAGPAALRVPIKKKRNSRLIFWLNILGIIMTVVVWLAFIFHKHWVPQFQRWMHGGSKGPVTKNIDPLAEVSRLQEKAERHWQDYNGGKERKYDDLEAAVFALEEARMELDRLPAKFKDAVNAKELEKPETKEAIAYYRQEITKRMRDMDKSMPIFAPPMSEALDAENAAENLFQKSAGGKDADLLRQAVARAEEALQKFEVLILRWGRCPRPQWADSPREHKADLTKKIAQWKALLGGGAPPPAPEGEPEEAPPAPKAPGGKAGPGPDGPAE